MVATCSVGTGDADNIPDDVDPDDDNDGTSDTSDFDDLDAIIAELD